jgi:hypothetical protein
MLVPIYFRAGYSTNCTVFLHIPLTTTVSFSKTTLCFSNFTYLIYTMMKQCCYGKPL